MVSALALFNALLMAYSRIPFVMATDRLLPAALGTTDKIGTPRNAVLVSAVFYSIFVLVPFGKLVIADVLLYSLALFLEFGALIRLRQCEPELGGAFRIPANRAGVIGLAALPMIVLTGVVAMSFSDGGIWNSRGNRRRGGHWTWADHVRLGARKELGGSAAPSGDDKTQAAQLLIMSAFGASA